jgi:metal-responsive CopG/Arc/MetJ family transcriptional regulator
MAQTIKMTFTLDERTAERIDRTAQRLGVSKSGVVREAVREYAARAGSLSEEERLRLLDVFDAVVSRIPRRPAEAVDREIAAVRRARREGGRRPEARRSR